MPRILIVDDQPEICWLLEKVARRLGHSATTLTSAEEMFHHLAENPCDLVVLDVRLPKMDGLEALGKLHANLPHVPVIVITAYGDLEIAVRAIQAGAFDYLTKPFTLEEVSQAIARALAAGTKTGTAETARPCEASSEIPRIIGVSSSMQAVFKQIALAAGTDAAVHISGESGTGKELVARAIHFYSLRRNRPLVVAHLAALSPTLVESELFGHVRGAFTGAERDRVGLLQRANGGTLFIDEVADIPLNIQAKLLRAIEYREFFPVGSDRPVRSDFRLISATHQDLRQLVAEGRFRHDLFYRLITFQITLPPLRERKEDIEPLARHFLGLWAAQAGKAPPPWSEHFLKALHDRPWWGNVRELRHALEHALIVSRGGVLHPDHLPPPLCRIQPGDDPCQSLQAAIKKWAEFALENADFDGRVHEAFLRIAEPILFEAALERHNGQFLGAARQLGIHRVTLRRRIEEYRASSKANDQDQEATDLPDSE